MTLQQNRQAEIIRFASQTNQSSSMAINQNEQTTTQVQPLQSRYTDPMNGLMKEKLTITNFNDLAKNTPPFKDYMNNLPAYNYLQQTLENEPITLGARHTKITPQYSSSTDEGCDTDHGGNTDFVYSEINLWKY